MVQVVVGRIGKAHGIRGEVTVEVRTDDPELRFAVDAELATDRPLTPVLVVERARPHHGRLLVQFQGVPDRNAAELLRGTLLSVDADDDPGLDDPDEFYDHQLEGLRVVTTDGRLVGNVKEVLHTAAGELLSVTSETGSEVLVPFVSAIVTEVSLADQTIEVDPPEGLLELQ